jgi:hypothetical protein
VKSDPLSLTIPLGNPNLATTFSKKASAKSLVFHVSTAGMYSDIFENRSTITRILSYAVLFFFAGGKPTMKSSDISSYTFPRIGRDAS